MDWNMAAYSPNIGTTYPAKSNKKKSVYKPSSLRKQIEIMSSDVFWKAVTPDCEELQPEQKTPVK